MVYLVSLVVNETVSMPQNLCVNLKATAVLSDPCHPGTSHPNPTTPAPDITDVEHSTRMPPFPTGDQKVAVEASRV